MPCCAVPCCAVLSSAVLCSLLCCIEPYSAVLVQFAPFDAPDPLSHPTHASPPGLSLPCQVLQAAWAARRRPLGGAGAGAEVLARCEQGETAWCLVRRGRAPEEAAADALLGPPGAGGGGRGGGGEAAGTGTSTSTSASAGAGAGAGGAGDEGSAAVVLEWVTDADVRAWHDARAAAAAAAAVPGAGGSKMKKKGAQAVAPAAAPAPLVLPPTVQEELRAEAARAIEAAAAQVGG